MSREENVDSENSVPTPEEYDLKKETFKRIPFSKPKKVNSHFKSPLQVAESPRVSPEEEVEELQRKNEQLDSGISQLEEE
ncbi:swi5-like zinc finger protein [Ataeniobius toweri]|uniref:Swi5-like zinc finger protein n=1 Tax=Ataeniobius toweri TaxID=208326 RepID=A0ABU7CJ59_9TELE|nr:swi5-like zinc finger protein [Ataeniobius toweri]